MLTLAVRGLPPEMPIGNAPYLPVCHVRTLDMPSTARRNVRGQCGG